MDDAIPTRQFLVMVDGPVGEEELFTILRNGLPDAEGYCRCSIQSRGSLLEINPNEGADSTLSTTDEEGYLYYRWRVEATPANSNISEDHQVDLARDVVRAMNEAGLRAVVCAAFEDRV